MRFDKRRGTWNDLWNDGATRRSKLIGTKQEYPTKAAAWEAVKTFTATLERRRAVCDVLTVNTLVTHYREEKMPKRTDTRRSYEVWLRNHILPKWGDCSSGRHAGATGGTVASLLSRYRRRARRTYAVCSASFGITPCGAETCPHNVTPWNWSR